jgi:hypothetical protein
MLKTDNTELQSAIDKKGLDVLHRGMLMSRLAAIVFILSTIALVLVSINASSTATCEVAPMTATVSCETEYSVGLAVGFIAWGTVANVFVAFLLKTWGDSLVLSAISTSDVAARKYQKSRKIKEIDLTDTYEVTVDGETRFLDADGYKENFGELPIPNDQRSPTWMQLMNPFR